MRQREIDPPEPVDLAAAIERLIVEEPEMGAWVLVAAGTGMRPGEQCALRWGDVDVDGEAIQVRGAVRKGKPGQDAWVLAETKTKRGRHVAIGHGVAQALGTLKARRDDRAAALGTSVAPEAFVFSLDLHGRTFTNPELWTHRWSRTHDDVALRDRYGLAGVRLYSLRHYAATQMIAAGYDAPAVAAQLGHSPEVLMRTYAHPIDENRRRAADALDATLRG